MILKPRSFFGCWATPLEDDGVTSVKSAWDDDFSAVLACQSLAKTITTALFWIPMAATHLQLPLSDRRSLSQKTSPMPADQPNCQMREESRRIRIMRQLDNHPIPLEDLQTRVTDILCRRPRAPTIHQTGQEPCFPTSRDELSNTTSLQPLNPKERRPWCQLQF